MGQVRCHRESTERQYSLKEKATTLGWRADQIRVLDGDLGISGASMTGREDFKTLVADVSLKKVGAVFALEASRLARSCADWHRLVELCSLTGTLMVDEDGCYDPGDFNDQLLLGLKGTMSQAELHFLRARLLGGKRNKAAKGELRFPLPVGLCYDEESGIVLDPNAEVRGAVSHVFSLFRERGSAYGVIHRFGAEGWSFPKRAYGGAWDGKLIWGPLGEARTLSILKNPSYAGAYVYGRYRSVREILPSGEITTKIREMPMDQWEVLIRDHHPGYITWDDYLENRKILEANQTNGEDRILGGAAREGLALVQGLLLCNVCGRRLTVRYRGNGGIYPIYECNWRKREGVSKRSCMTVACCIVDKAVSRRVLDILSPSQVEIAVAAVEELARRTDAASKQWEMRIERADYEAQLAQRRYEEVDPSNRLVAATLERRWNEALINLEQVKQEYATHQSTRAVAATPEQKARALSLARDLPRLWNAPTTKSKDRKRILRLLIKDITVERVGKKKLVLHTRWQGGACEDILAEVPPNAPDRVRYPEKLVAKVRELARDLRDQEVADALNAQGLRSAKGKPFTVDMIRWIRFKHGISLPQQRRPGEMSVHDVAARLGVRPGVVYYWIRRDIVSARRVNQGSPCWITMDSAKEEELREWVRTSTKIQKGRSADSKGVL
jgi:DNA invertase Pin-like site-specific DNA recombinase